MTFKKIHTVLGEIILFSTRQTEISLCLEHEEDFSECHTVCLPCCGGSHRIFVGSELGGKKNAVNRKDLQLLTSVYQKLVVFIEL